MNKQEAKKRLMDELSRLDVGPTAYANLKIAIGRMLDAIEDHPKVKLPREVGEELDEWKKSNFDENLSGYIEDVDAGLDDVEKAMYWIYCRDSKTQQTRTELYGILADAYRYGWEAEPEAKWYVKAPENWNAAVGIEFRWVSMRGGEFNLTVKGQAQTFTKAELKKYHLDSDIFTLVPVEDSHED